MGHALEGKTLVKHNIKRIDRLAGNAQLLAEHTLIYAALNYWLLGSAERPLIIVDWSDLSQDRKWHLRQNGASCWRSDINDL